MSVTINSLGSNSRQIVITNETSATSIINAVNTSLVALGWTLIDTITSGIRGLLTTRVYSAPNADGVTTKYMIIRYDLQRQYWFTSCCENWNTTTNTATNESWYGGRNILLPLQYSNTVLYVFANARYACFMGVVNGEPGPWQGVFEFEREAPDDIANKTLPCYGWTSSLTIGEPYGNFVTPVFNSAPAAGATSANAGFVAAGFAPPRTANGLTGISAANNFAIMTAINQYPPSEGIMTTDWSSGGIIQSRNSHCGMLGGFAEGNSAYVWDVYKTIVSNMKLAGYASGYIAGKIYGLKITQKLGTPLNTIIIPVDANLFYSQSGTPTNHAMLGIHGGYKDKITAGTNRLLSNVYSSATALGTPYQSVLVSGRFIYLTTSTGFHKFDALNLTFSYNVLPAGAYTAVKFDGENSLYVTTGTTTVYKLNLSNESYTTYTSSVAVSGISMDDEHLYAVSNNNTGTSVTVNKINLGTFTQTASWTLTIISGTWVTHVSAADYSGFLYVGVLGNTAQGSCRIFRVDTNTGLNSSITPPSNTIPTLVGANPIFFDGAYLYFALSGASGAASNLQSILYRLQLSDFSLPGTNGLTHSAFTIVNYFGGLTLHGCIEVPSFAGLQIYTANSSSNSLKLPFSDPRVPNGMSAIPGDTQALDSTNTTMLGQPATDQCTLYCFNTTQVLRYQGAFRNYNFNGVQTSNLLIAQ